DNVMDRYDYHREPHSFPTRRSSDLLDHPRFRSDFERRYTPSGVTDELVRPESGRRCNTPEHSCCCTRRTTPAAIATDSSRVSGTDRKSTRLNSSHVKISYAVFCLKK